MEISEIKNLKIVPKNYECATAFEVFGIDKDNVKIKLSASKDELEGYILNEKVEMFGLFLEGLVYFTSIILKKEDNILTIKKPSDYKKIQRRKYTRVSLLGTLNLTHYKDAVISPIDISAGGLKFISDTSIKAGKEYEIRLELVNNLVIDCTMEPIRVCPLEGGFEISAKFKKIRSIDRIALVQYSLRMKSESENKG